MWRRRLAASLIGVALAAFAPAEAGAGGGKAAGETVEIYYTGPVLAAAGETVHVPVDVVCYSVQGRACRTKLTVGARVAGATWHVATAMAQPETILDLTPLLPTAGTAGGRIEFYLHAWSTTSTASATLPASGREAPLVLRVVPRIPEVEVPAVAFGAVRQTSRVLFLPWGTGPTKAGLSLGAEGPSLGPRAFDVDRLGRVHLLDTFQRRVAVFDHGRLIRQVRVGVAAHDLAATASGDSFLLARTPDGTREVAVASLSGGVLGRWTSVGPGVPSEVRTLDDRAYAHLLPLDGWVAAGHPGEMTVGRPIQDGQLLRVVRGNTVRIGLATPDEVRNPIDLSFRQHVGEIALAEPDGAGGYWVVVHVWRDNPETADQYQVVHVGESLSVETFAVPARYFADPAPLSRFRMGGDGRLYQLVTTSRGMSVVRLDTGGPS